MKAIRKHPFLQTMTLLLLLPAFVLLPTSVRSNPSGENVKHGDVEFEFSDNMLKILQESDKSIIEWDGFSIGKGETTEFVMPGRGSASLNRVTGPGASAIEGALKANGTVWLINQNGILFGPDSVVDVGGLLASTLDVSDDQFLAGGAFTLAGSSAASVVNMGRINIADGGEAYLVAQNVENHGVIGGFDTKIALVGASEVLIQPGKFGMGNITVTGTPQGGAHVTNTGVIQGAEVHLEAHNNNVFGMAVQNDGIVRAQTVDRSGGRVVLRSNAGIANNGLVDASGDGPGGGGVIEVDAGREIRIGATGQFLASGSTSRGGTIDMDGAAIFLEPGAQVSARGLTDGGNVTIGSDGLDGKTPTDIVMAGVGSNVDVRAENGIGGTITTNSNGLTMLEGLMDASSTNGAGGTITFNSGELIASGTILARGDTVGGNVTANVDTTMTVLGTIDVGSGSGDGGIVNASAEDIIVGGDGRILADGASGGTIALDAQKELFIAGEVSAQGTDGMGGTIIARGEDVIVAGGGIINASGTDGGGTIGITATDEAVIFGTVQATGGEGDGGTIFVDGTTVFVAPTGVIDASGASGGAITVTASERAEIAGSIRSVGSDGAGGIVTVTGNEVALAPTANIDAGGATNGGQVFLGGGFQGSDPSISNAQNVSVAPGAQINASGGTDGGLVAVWSDGATDFQGNIDVSGGRNGGLAEVSGRETLTFGGSVYALGGTGANGTLLLDPVDVIVGSGDPGEIAAAALIGSLATSNVIVHTAPTGVTPDPGDPGNITIEEGTNLEYNSPNSLTFFAHNNFNMSGNSTVWNGGGGNITVVAGWDPTTAVTDPTTLFTGGQQTHNHETTTPILPNGTGPGGQIQAADILAGTFGSFGVGGGGDFEIEANGTGGNQYVAGIGSAHGETNVFANNVILRAGNDRERAQIGWSIYNAGNSDSTGINEAFISTGVYTNGKIAGDTEVYGVGDARNNPNAGNVNVHAEGSLLMISSNRSYTRVGHGGSARANWSGGTNSLENGHLNGDVTVRADGGILMTGGSDRLGETAIGHGGTSEDWGGRPVRVGNLSGDIDVEANSITMQAGNRLSPAIIGHGGFRFKGEHSGHIRVVSVGNIRAEGGSGSTDRRRTWVQIGHGGWDSDHVDGLPFNIDGGSAIGDEIPTVAEVNIAAAAQNGGDVPLVGIVDPGSRKVGHAGNIYVSSGGRVQFTAGSDEDSWGQIGHGGRSTAGEFGSWDIDAWDEDGVTLNSNGEWVAEANTDNWATDTDGDITVLANGGGVIFDRTIETGALADGVRSHVQIGHGGYVSAGGGHGDIHVEAGNGNVEFYGGRGDSPAQIGHGGRSEFWSGGAAGAEHNNAFAQGTHTGDIFVSATGDVIFRSGFGQSTARSFSQIGHGGWRNMAGRDETTADGAFFLGEGFNGDITVNAGGNIDFFAGLREFAITDSSGAVILQADALLPGMDMYENNALEDGYTQIGHGGVEARGDHWGNITLNAGGMISIEATGGWDAVGYENNPETEFSGNTNENNDENPLSTTGVTGIAQYGTTADNSYNGRRNYAMIGHGGFNTDHNANAENVRQRTGSFARGMGYLGDSNITINSTGGGLRVAAPQTANIGRQRHNSFTFDRDLGFISADTSPTDAIYLDPLITFRDNNTGLALPGAVQSSEDGFAQIGHGGRASDIRAADDLAGTGRTPGHHGNISINVAGQVDVLASDFVRGQEVGIIPGGVAPVTWSPGNLDNGFLFNDDLYNLAFYYDAADGIIDNLAQGGTTAYTVPGGPNVPAGAFIVSDVFTSYDFQDARENVNEDGGNVNLTTGVISNSNNFLTISYYERENGGIQFSNDSLNSDNGYAQIGHGGIDSTAGALQGDITVNSTDGGLTVRAGNNVRSFAMIGHGGDDGGQDRTQPVRGHINVDVFGGIDMDAGKRTYAFSQIGHGGADFASNNFLFEVRDSNITVRARAGNIDIDGGPFAARSFNQGNGQALTHDYQWAMIGHGGRNSDMDIDADIAVRADDGDINVRGGRLLGNFAKIGHGGRNFDRGPVGVGSTFIGDIMVDAAGEINVEGGISPTEFDYGGAVNPTAGPTDDPITGGVRDNEGETIFAQNFYPSNYNTLLATFAQIGHGGYLIGDNNRGVTMDGDIMINTILGGTNVNLQGGDADSAFALIGHGGDRLDNAELITGDVTVNAANDINILGGLRFLNGGDSGGGSPLFNSGNYAAIGHQLVPDNARRTGQAIGDINVAAGGNLNMIAGGGVGASSRIGNGANFESPSLELGNLTADQTGDHSGDISVVVGGNLTMRGALAAAADPNNPSTSTLPDGTPIFGIPGTGGAAGFETLPGGVASVAQIGHGGPGVNSQGGFEGNIEVLVGGDLDARSGTARDAYTKIGHGDFMFDDPGTAGTGFSQGSISIGVGDSASFGSVNVGNSNDISNLIWLDGSTTIGVSRLDPTGASGTGTLSIFESVNVDRLADGVDDLIVPPTTVVSDFTSGLGDELRFYMPGRTTFNVIEDGTLMNSSAYSRPTDGDPLRTGGNAGDELLPFPEFTMAIDPVSGLPSGSFGTPPQGPYPAQGFGDYNIYYVIDPETGAVLIGGGGGGGGGGDGLPAPDSPPAPLPEVIPPLVVDDTPILPTIIPPQFSPFQLFLLDLFFSGAIPTEIARQLDPNFDRNVQLALQAGIVFGDGRSVDVPGGPGIGSVGSATGNQFRVFSVEEIMDMGGLPFDLNDIGSGNLSDSDGTVGIDDPFAMSTDGNGSPVAGSDTVPLSADGPTNISLLENDSDPDGDPLSIIAVNGTAIAVGTPVNLPSGASVVLKGDGTLDYLPGANASGSDSFSYTVSDGKGGTSTGKVTIGGGAPAADPFGFGDAPTSGAPSMENDPFAN